MSRRARTRAAAVAAKYIALVPLDDEPDDDCNADDDPRCYVCGERQSVTDSGCKGIGGECAECPRW